MSGIPEPTRPAPRRRNPIAQAAKSLRTAEDTAATPSATQQSVAQETPATESVAHKAPAAPEPVAHVTPAVPKPVAHTESGPKKRKAATTDILLSISEDLKERMVATLEHTRPRTGITSQQQFIRTAIDQLCKRLETEYNNGEAFPPPAQGINL